jgi:hypothetical protein
VIKTTKAQRKALFRVFQRDFPSHVTPFYRMAFVGTQGTVKSQVPSTQYRRFRAKVHPGPGCIMLPWRGMWLGIEPDGYTHS